MPLVDWTGLDRGRSAEDDGSENEGFSSEIAECLMWVGFMKVRERMTRLSSIPFGFLSVDNIFMDGPQVRPQFIYSTKSSPVKFILSKL